MHLVIHLSVFDGDDLLEVRRRTGPRALGADEQRSVIDLLLDS